MSTLNARANQAWIDEVADEPTDDNAGFSHQRAAFEEGWETGYKTAAAEAGSPAPLDRSTALDAAAKARYYENADYDTPPWEEMSEDSHESWRSEVRVAVDAVLKLLPGGAS